ncbi:MAG: 4Fe-4S dicluster domain-containing protein [Anaerolineales bacterium]|nr:4Fe-4S dicluster domain-containing protein [Anaerolineales bacterium]
MNERSRIRPVHLVWKKDRCTTCMSCMTACSEYHTGSAQMSRSRIRILVDVLGAGYSAEYCRQCKKAACALACPQDAIYLDKTTGGWLIDEQCCNGCGECIAACPFNAITMEETATHPLKCDLCGGAARCVRACPAGALKIIGESAEGDTGE